METFKARMLGPKVLSANALSEEVGIAQPKLSGWLRETSSFRAMAKKDQNRAPQRTLRRQESARKIGRLASDCARWRRCWPSTARNSASISAAPGSHVARRVEMLRRVGTGGEMEWYESRATARLVAFDARRKLFLDSPPPPHTRMKGIPVIDRTRAALLIAALAFLAHLALAIYQIGHQPPINDEALYAGPALTLVRGDGFGSTVLEPRASPLVGVDKITYYALPGHPLTNAALLAIFGFSLAALRAKSLIFMLASAALVFRILRRQGLPRPYAALALALVFINRNWLQASVVARPDAQCFFFGLAGVFAFATGLEEARPLRAALGGFLVVAAGLTHVNGAIFGLLSILVAGRYLVGYGGRAWRTPALWTAALGALPPLVAYYLFTRRYPAFYQGQMGWNATVWNRLDAWTHPFSAFAKELVRWFPHANAGTLPNVIVYGLVSTVGFAGLAGLLLSSPSVLRTSIAAYVACALLSFAFVNNIDSGFYLFYRSFVLDVALVVVLWLQDRPGRRWPRAAASAGLLLLFGFSLRRDAAFVSRARTEARAYRLVVNALFAAQGEGDMIFGPLELAVPLAFAPRFIVDDHYGFYSGRRPTLVVIHREVGTSPRPLDDVGSGGLCAADPRGFQEFARFNGPTVTALVTRDKERICAYLRGLAARSQLVYEGAEYELLRIGASSVSDHGTRDGQLP